MRGGAKGRRRGDAQVARKRVLLHETFRHHLRARRRARQAPRWGCSRHRKGKRTEISPICSLLKAKRVEGAGGGARRLVTSLKWDGVARARRRTRHFR